MRHALALVLAGAMTGLLAFMFPAAAARIVVLRDGGSDAAIVFVHGLDGSAATTFVNQQRDPPLSWPDLVKGDERQVLPGFRPDLRMSSFDLFAIDYSDVFTDTRVDVSVEQIAQQVTAVLEGSPILHDHKYVWIVAHSLGGIIMKRAIIKWSNVSYDGYVRHILGVSLLGVPSNGAPLANYADKIGPLIEEWFGYKARHISDLKTLNSTNTFLQSLENDWQQFRVRRDREFNGLPLISCAYEAAAEVTITWRPFGVPVRTEKIEIVPEIYTKTGCDGESMPINKSHTGLPKPASKDDPIENWLFQAVRNAFNKKAMSGAHVFNMADEPGAFDGLIYHINKGHGRRDAAGMPLVDETVNVEGAIPDGFKLKGSRYQGPSWAEVIGKIAEDNSCIVADFSDRRQSVRIRVQGAVACGGSSAPAMACSPDSC